ncbi:hypothetical protein ACOMHN_014332 [Nucella lapillus]
MKSLLCVSLLLLVICTHHAATAAAVQTHCPWISYDPIIRYMKERMSYHKNNWSVHVFFNHYCENQVLICNHGICTQTPLKPDVRLALLPQQQTRSDSDYQVSKVMKGMWGVVFSLPQWPWVQPGEEFHTT